MLDIAQLSSVAQFLFFVGCGYLALQLPFGWVAVMLGGLLAKGITLSTGSVWGFSLNALGTGVGYLIISSLFIGLGFALLGKFPAWSVFIFFVILLLLTLVGSIFSVYALFKTTSTFPLNIGIKILAFLLGAVLGTTSWIIAHTSMLLSAMSSSYTPQLILMTFISSIICAVVVSVGTYFVITSPKVGYWVLGGAVGIILFLFFGFFALLRGARWT